MKKNKNNWVGSGIAILLIIQINTGVLAMEQEKKERKFTPTFLAKDVLNDGAIILSNKNIINLAGIRVYLSKESELFIKKLILNKRIVIIPEDKLKEKSIFYVYLVDFKTKEIPFKLNNVAPEARGFLDLKIGADIGKGMLYNLNTILLRMGYAKVDKKYSFDYLAYFEECEREARNNKRGIWKQQNHATQ